MEINPDIDVLLGKHFAGELSDTEQKVLDDWLSLSDTHQAYFDRLTLLYEKSRPIRHAQKPDTTKALEKFRQHISGASQKTIPKVRRYRNYWITAAAAIILFVSLGIFLYQRNETPGSITLASTSEVVQKILADSTVVCLDTNSSITYAAGYGLHNRDIYLNGKATFEVKHHSNTALKVVVGEVCIEDIGTVFTVEGDTDSEHVTVKVESGTVSFYTASDKGLTLLAGETGLYERNIRQFKKMQQEWKLVFEAASLPEAVAQLSQYYNIPIVLNGESLHNLRISVAFKEEPIGRVLDIIAETLSLDVTYENGEYILSAKKK